MSGAGEAAKGASGADMLADYAGAQTIEEVRAVLVRRTARLGFRCVALVCPAAALEMHNYPEAWAERRADGEPVDPMFEVAASRTWPFFWRDPDVLAGLDARRGEMLQEAAALGVADGFSVPITPPSAPPAAGSVIPGPEPPAPLAYRIAHSEIVLAHERSRSLIGCEPSPRIGLTECERDCLVLAARGKTDWEIGRILGMSQRQVHYVIERAKARAGVTTRVQAIVHAFASGELGIAEALKDPVARG